MICKKGKQKLQIKPFSVQIEKKIIKKQMKIL